MKRNFKPLSFLRHLKEMVFTSYSEIIIKMENNKKVSFSNKDKIYNMYVWKYAYKNARIGSWEIFARDRYRFQRRIKDCESILSKILDDNHRKKMYEIITNTNTTTTTTTTTTTNTTTTTTTTNNNYFV